MGNEMIKSPNYTFKKDSFVNMTPNMNPGETTAGTNDNMNQSYQGNRPFMFSPSPFMPNRSPGVSPNIMPSYDSLVRHSKVMNNMPYSNRGNDLPNVNSYPVQSVNQTPNVNAYPNTHMMNVSPSGFTPLRTNFARQSPLFSPGNMYNNNPFMMK
jgi:hypothetical protein